MLDDQQEKCIYCKHQLKISIGNKSLDQVSIDRADSLGGYTKTNIRMCCLFCNLAKSTINETLFVSFIDVIKGKCETEIVHDHGIDTKKFIIPDLRRSCAAYDKKNFDDPPETISSKEIRDLIEKQDNKCAITGISFIESSVKCYPFKISVDRVDNDKSHTLENCKIVCCGIQLGKNNKSYEDMNQYIKEIKESK